MTSMVGFTLTMWDVKQTMIKKVAEAGARFTLTMWDVKQFCD